MMENGKCPYLFRKMVAVAILIAGFAFCGFAYTVNPDHPRIFITLGEVDTLRARCGLGGSSDEQYMTHQYEYNEVKTAADAYSYEQLSGLDAKNLSRVCAACAFVYVVEGGDAYLDKAKCLLERISGLSDNEDGHNAFFCGCIVYDWVYNQLSPAEREAFSGDIINFAANVSRWYESYNSFDPFASGRKYMADLFSISGQSVYSENPSAAEVLIDRAFMVYNRMMTAQNEIAPGGYIYPVGQAQYFDESGWTSPLKMLAGIKFAGLSGAEVDNIEYGSLSNTAYGEIYSLVKNNYAVNHNDVILEQDLPWDKLRGPPGPFYSAILAKLHEGEEIGRITNYLQNSYCEMPAESVFVLLGSIIFNNKIANAVGTVVSDLPLTKVFDETVLVYRQGWRGLAADNNEVLFYFMCEKHAYGHTHPARGHFDIWRGYDPLAFMSGSYCNTSYQHYIYFKDSLAHNVMLIRNPDEDTGSRPNDGGQLILGDSDCWARLGHTFEGGCAYAGRMKRRAFSEDYFYSYIHYPEAYSRSRVDDISRSVVRIGDYFIVLDRIDGVNASFAKKWLLHSNGEPVIRDSGEWNGGVPPDGNGGTPNQTSSNAKLLSMSYGDSVLHVKSVFPLNAIIHRVGGSPDYKWYSYNEGINYSFGAPGGNNHGNWRIEIESAEKAENDIFLTVLYPAGSTGAMPDIEGFEGSNYVGARIMDSVEKTLVFSNSVDEQTKETGYRFDIDSDAEMQILVCDLEEDVYDIYRNGFIVDTQAVDDSSVLFFTVTGGGSFDIVNGAVLPPEPMTGDLNGDGVINIRDVQECVNDDNFDMSVLREIINVILGAEQ